MSAYNVVRFRVRPGRDEGFLAAHRDGRANWPGLRRGVIIGTGERSYCLIGEWLDLDTLKRGIAPMTATLNTFRAELEDLGSGLGVTDAISGPVVLDLQS